MPWPAYTIQSWPLVSLWHFCKKHVTFSTSSESRSDPGLHIVWRISLTNCYPCFWGKSHVWLVGIPFTNWVQNLVDNKDIHKRKRTPHEKWPEWTSPHDYTSWPFCPLGWAGWFAFFSLTSLSYVNQYSTTVNLFWLLTFDHFFFHCQFFPKPYLHITHPPSYYTDLNFSPAY